MLTTKQFSMLQNQKCDFINSDSEDFVPPQDHLKQIDATDYQTFSPCDINLVRGTLYGKTEEDPNIIDLMKDEFKSNTIVSGTALDLDDSLEPLVQQFGLPNGVEESRRSSLNKKEKQISNDVKKLMGQLKKIKEIKQENSSDD